MGQDECFYKRVTRQENKYRRNYRQWQLDNRVKIKMQKSGKTNNDRRN